MHGYFRYDDYSEYEKNSAKTITNTVLLIGLSIPFKQCTDESLGLTGMYKYKWWTKISNEQITLLTQVNNGQNQATSEQLIIL